MTRTVVVVQARMGSTRLPGKVLKPIGDRRVIDHVLARCKRIGSADLVCCAVPDEPASETLVAAAKENDVAVVLGSEDDVLARFQKAAIETDADVLLRVTCDCPLIDPGLCDELIALRAETGADYGNNIDPRCWPDGLDCEVFTRATLERAVAETFEKRDREHVTPWMRRHPDLRRCHLPSPDVAWGALRWTLDYPEDLAFFEALNDRLSADGKDPAAAGYSDIMDVLRRDPKIAAINAVHPAGPVSGQADLPTHD